MTEQVLILQTGRLHEVGLTCNALTEASIPFFKQKEVSGVKTVIITPAAGPGIFWNLLVPAPMKTDAEKILKERPIDLTTEPDFWHFSGKPYAIKFTSGDSLKNTPLLSRTVEAVEKVPEIKK